MISENYVINSKFYIFNSQRRDDGRNNMGGRGGPRGNGFGGNRNPNEYGSWDRRPGGPMQDKIETTFTVPSSKCGIIIGKGFILFTI